MYWSIFEFLFNSNIFIELIFSFSQRWFRGSEKLKKDLTFLGVLKRDKVPFINPTKRPNAQTPICPNAQTPKRPHAQVH